MRFQLAVLAVCVAVATTAPLEKESKLDKLIRLLSEVVEKEEVARFKEEIVEWTTHVVKSNYALGETRAIELMREYGAMTDSDNQKTWQVHVLMTPRGAREGVMLESHVDGADDFNKLLDLLKEKGVISKLQRESAFKFLENKAASLKFNVLVRIMFKPAKTVLAIGFA